METNGAQVEDGLVQRAIGGDQRAVTDLLRRFGPGVVKALERHIPASLKALLSTEDVLQETYIDTFLHIQELRGRTTAAFRGWLTALARHNLLGAIRLFRASKRGGNNRRIDATSDDRFYDLYIRATSTRTTASENLARSEADEAVSRGVASLPEVHRKVIQMYDLDGIPIEEVAAAIGRSQGAVYMLRSRALRHLADVLSTDNAVAIPLSHSR